MIYEVIGGNKVGEKQIYASLEIVDHEVRLVVGEFYNTRLNVIRVERVPTNGIENHVIINENAVIESIKTAVENASNFIGAKVTGVILSVAAVDFKRVSSIYSNTFLAKKPIEKSDIQACVKQAIEIEDASLVVVNYVCNRYLINNKWHKKPLLNEVADEISVDIDVSLVDKKMFYQYALCTERAGLEIIDVYTDMYAIAKESNLLEASHHKYDVLVKLERNSTSLSLLYNERLITSEILNIGFEKFILKIMDVYQIPYQEALEIFKYSCRYDASIEKMQNNKALVYLWEKDGNKSMLTEKQLYELLHADVISWVNEIKKVCQAILEEQDVHISLHGEGAAILSIKSLFEKYFNVSVSIGRPTAVGAQLSDLTVNLGLFYAYKEQEKIRNHNTAGLDMLEFDKMIYKKRSKTANLEDSLTNKFKGFLRK